MKLANKVQEWVISKDIEHQFTVNEDDQTSMLKFSYLLNSQKFLGIIETDEQRDAIKAFIYAPFNVLPNKINEFCILLNRLNLVENFGAVSVASDGSIRWRHFVDFEKTDPSIEAIDNLFNPGGSILHGWFDELTAVALTNTTAQEIFEFIEESNS